MKNKEMVEIWGDVVALKSLAIAMVISSVCTMGMYFLAPANDKTNQLFFGLGGAVLGFVICTIFIKPKRVIVESREENDI